jgi:uncharacterized protein YndB with AHSA1/START domain
MASMGTVERTEDGRFAVRFERSFAHPREKVWRAITEPAHLSRWFPAVVDFDVKPGATIRFGVTAEQVERLSFPEDQATYGKMLQIDPPGLLEYSWDTEILRWELSEDGAGGTLLVFTNIVADQETASRVGAGWHAGLEVVEAIVDDRPVDWSAWDRAERLTEKYGVRLNG